MIALIAAPGAGANARTTVTIDTWPEGLFGSVESPNAARCANGRSVSIYVQRGDHRDRDRDPRIATTEAKRNRGVFQWSERIGRSGSFYARASGTGRCEAAVSRTVHSPDLVGAGADSGGAEYPSCSPYIGETAYTICNFDRLHVDLGSNCPSYKDNDTGYCFGQPTSGPFPWGAYQGNSGVQFHWDHRKKEVLLVALRHGMGNTGVAHVGGWTPARNSNVFNVTEAYAMDDRGYPNGPKFFTGNVPGQAPGEVGGPLNLDVSGGRKTDLYINGYLYLEF